MKNFTVSWDAIYLALSSGNKWAGLPPEVTRLLEHTDIFAPVGALCGHLQGDKTYKVTIRVEELQHKSGM